MPLYANQKVVGFGPLQLAPLLSLARFYAFSRLVKRPGGGRLVHHRHQLTPSSCYSWAAPTISNGFAGQHGTRRFKPTGSYKLIGSSCHPNVTFKLLSAPADAKHRCVLRNEPIQQAQFYSSRAGSKRTSSCTSAAVTGGIECPSPAPMIRPSRLLWQGGGRGKPQRACRREQTANQSNTRQAGFCNLRS